MDYLLPSATDMPTLEVEHTETPSPNTPKGIKGMGEGGAIGPPAAIGNAIADALAPFDVKVTATPLSPNAIWQLIHAANGDRAA
jgi:carbon-monoxide dehydrogenase large subunit